MKIIGVTQARFGSSRLPGKVLLLVKGKPLLQIHLERAIKSKLVDKWILATTKEVESKNICAIALNLGVECYKGETNDVLDRFYQAVVNESPDYVVRITSDCPLIDPELIDEAVKIALDNKLRYYYNRMHKGYPDGLDVEVFDFDSLQRAWKNALLPEQREHVTAYIRNAEKEFALQPSFVEEKYVDLSVTVDTKADFDRVNSLVARKGFDSSWREYADCILQNSTSFF